MRGPSSRAGSRCLFLGWVDGHWEGAAGPRGGRRSDKASGREGKERPFRWRHKVRTILPRNALRRLTGEGEEPEAEEEEPEAEEKVGGKEKPPQLGTSGRNRSSAAGASETARRIAPPHHIHDSVAAV